MSEVRLCPVCGGKGIVPNGFYTSTNPYWTTSSTAAETCKACGGTGYIVIGATENTPPAQFPNFPVSEKQEVKMVWEAKWTNVGDSLPTPGEEVLVTVIDNSGDSEFRYTTVGWYTGWEDKWVVDNELTALVEYWAEKPEPKGD